MEQSTKKFLADILTDKLSGVALKEEALKFYESVCIHLSSSDKVNILIPDVGNKLIDKTVYDEILHLIHRPAEFSGQNTDLKIQAIKLLRTVTGVGLKEAKEAVDRL